MGAGAEEMRDSTLFDSYVTISRDMNGRTKPHLVSSTPVLTDCRKTHLSAVKNVKKRENRLPKDKMWSAIPVALLCMIVNE